MLEIDDGHIFLLKHSPDGGMEDNAETLNAEALSALESIGVESSRSRLEVAKEAILIQERTDSLFRFRVQLNDWLTEARALSLWKSDPTLSTLSLRDLPSRGV